MYLMGVTLTTIAETEFKAFARALRKAVENDPRVIGVPSTKGSLVTQAKVVVLDYGSGNVHSVVNALVNQGAEVELTEDRAKALEADGLVVPGVGAFATVMDQLNCDWCTFTY